MGLGSFSPISSPLLPMDPSFPLTATCCGYCCSSFFHHQPLLARSIPTPRLSTDTPSDRGLFHKPLNHSFALPLVPSFCEHPGRPFLANQTRTPALPVDPNAHCQSIRTHRDHTPRPGALSFLVSQAVLDPRAPATVHRPANLSTVAQDWADVHRPA
ncbi:hypothetical protein VTK73DRAFT_2569 [Phialemonium thermophilum]|uniref:Uncharacterized protein n=1 Tax=Phialemonium thermophilum TaxID=223376 RepID=A0ABR3VRY1_9PEZI